MTPQQNETHATVADWLTDKERRSIALKLADSYRVVRGNPSRGPTGGFCRTMRRLHLATAKEYRDTPSRLG